MGHVELVDQALDAAGFFQRVEVLALDVLDQRHRQRGLVGDLAHQAGHLDEPGDLRRAPAPFAGDDLVRVLGHRPHHDRLHHALGLDRGSELLQRARVHARARLVLAGLQRDRGQGLQLALLDFLFLVRGQQRVESAAEALESGFVHVGSGIQKVFARSIISCAKAM